MWWHCRWILWHENFEQQLCSTYTYAYGLSFSRRLAWGEVWLEGEFFFWAGLASMSLRERSSSTFYTHRTRTSTMFVKKDRKNAFNCLSAFSETGSLRFFLNFFFCRSIIHPKKNLITMWSTQMFHILLCM